MFTNTSVLINFLRTITNNVECAIAAPAWLAWTVVGFGVAVVVAMIVSIIAMIIETLR